MATYVSYAGQLANRLHDLRTRGQKEGSKHRPPPDATAPDQNESEVKAEAEGHMSAEQRLFDNTLTEVARSSTEARQKAIELRTTYDQIVRDDTTLSAVDSEMANDRAKLVKAAELRLRAEADLRYFRARNDIQEEASFPESRLLHIGLLFACALIEILVNAFFYENSEGLLGGVTVAAGIALINIGTAFFLGLGFRYKNLAANDKKVAGWICLVVFVLLSIFCNSLFAAFRSEYQLVVDATENAQVFMAFQRAWPEAFLIFKLAPHFKDHWSFLLFGIGLLLSIYAFYEGYTFEDRFPGHGEKTRMYRAAVEAELQQQDLLRQKVKELLHHRKAAIQAAMFEPGTQIGMLARRIADLTHARQEVEAQAGAIQRDYQMVIEAYRHANTSVRAVEVPAYFREPAVLSTKIDTGSADRVISELNAVQNELKSLGDQHRDVMNEKLKALHEDSSNVLTEKVSAYMAEVAKEAQDVITRMTPTIHRVKAA